MVVTKKKHALALRKTVVVTPTLSGKRSRMDAKMVGKAPRPKKGVKKLAKRGEWEIHVISSQTTGTTTSNAYFPSPAVKVSAVGQQDLVEPVANLTVEEPVTSTPAVAQAKVSSAIATPERAAFIAKRTSPEI